MSASRPASKTGAAEPPEVQGARERILTAATRLFQQSGYEGTSVIRIARAAEMTPANMYWHFPSKQDVLMEVLSSMYRRSYQVLFATIPEGKAADRLAHYVRAYVWMQLTELGEHANFGYASLASSLSPEMQDELSRLGRPYLELLRGILQQGIDEGVFQIDDLPVTSFAISSMCEYVFTWYRTGGRLTIDEVRDAYVRLIHQMVQHDPSREAATATDRKAQVAR